MDTDLTLGVSTDKAVELAQSGEDIYASDLIDSDELESLANSAVVKRLNQRADVITTESLYPWIPRWLLNHFVRLNSIPL